MGQPMNTHPPPSGIAAIKWQAGQVRPVAVQRANKTSKTGRKQHQIDCETWRDNANGRERQRPGKNGTNKTRAKTKEENNSEGCPRRYARYWTHSRELWVLHTQYVDDSIWAGFASWPTE